MSLQPGVVSPRVFIVLVIYPWIMLAGSVLQPWIVPCAWEADSSGCCRNERLVNSDFNACIVGSFKVIYSEIVINKTISFRENVVLIQGVQVSISMWNLNNTILNIIIIIIIIITVVASSCFIEESDLYETISGKVQQGPNWIQGIHCT